VIVAYVATGMALAGRGMSVSDRLAVVGVCFILHMGYGYGYWKGIWDFLIVSRPPREDLQRQTT
jgi:hypothetical protein